MSKRRTRHLTFGTVVSHLFVLVAVSAVMGVLVAGLVIPFAGALGIGTKAASDSLRNLPQALRAEPLAQRTLVLDRSGKVIATFYDQNRVAVPLSKVAPMMRHAIVSIEDYRFYHHGALDLKGTLRAFVTNQTNNGVTQGGSSITQQLAKMTQLDQARTSAQRAAATADTYQRKIAELRHAMAFEQNYSKNWILGRYLNIAYFGDGAYGIQSASRHYFSVDAANLNLAQSALLAGLVKNPAGYNPATNPDQALARRNVVLERMAQLRVISQPLATRLEGTGLGLKITSVRNGCVGTPTPFFCDYVHRYLLADPSLGNTVNERNQLINAGGLTIKTSVDQRFQAAADRAVTAHVRPTDRAIGAMAMVQPGTGAVLAIAQSRPMGTNSRKGQTFLDYAVPHAVGDAQGFQGGSTFKLFVLSSALELGLPTSTSFNSPPKLSLPQNAFPTCQGNYPIFSPWVVHNSTTSGFKNMYTGTQQSVNTYFAQLEKKVGLCRPFALARAMGVTLNDPGTQRVPTFTLGVADVSPLEMAGAYATVAARGLYCAPRPVTQILNSAGKVFKDYPKQCRQVMQTNTADTVNDILKGVMAPGGFGALLTLDKPSAGKTGTTDNNVAVWFDGYTPNLATSSVIAGANQQGHPVSLNNQVVGGQFVATAHGSTTAGPMWADAMRAVQDLIPYADFVKPTSQGAALQVTLPDVTGMSITQATQTLQSIGLQAIEANSMKAPGPKGRVFLTSPPPGSPAYQGSTIYLFPSR
ncbi:MAG: transglycosylase domain-containing protein [Actinomycetota bacterium]|nr:transglycosylase domain-containing protein [Actinomycetota bacterium]